MKDLKARWKLVAGLVVLLPFLMTMLGCQGLDAGQPASHGNGLVAQFPTLQFGAVVVGGNRALGDTISNPTNSSITITDVSVTSGDFKIIGPAFPVTLGPGRSIYLSLAFGPQATGSLDGTVVMSTVTGKTAGSSTFTVSGKAVPPGKAGFNPNSLSFGNVLVGGKQTKSATITNSGESMLTVSAMSASGTAFALLGPSVPFTLIPGQSVNYSVTFSPKNPGPINGSLTVTSSASLSVYGRGRDFRPHGSTGNTTTTLTMNGNGMMAGELSATPSSLNFGTVTVNNSRSLPTILQNTGGTTITVSQATVTGAGFGVTGLALPLTLAPGQTTTFNATYNPSTAGSSTGNIAISSDASNSVLNIALSGTAVTQGALTVSPSSIAFGNVQVGSNQKQTATLTNTGGASISVTQAVATGAGFSISGLSLPLTLNAGQTSSFTVTFAPTTGGSASGNVAFTSNASNSSLNMPLTGTGLAAGALTANPSSLSFGSVQLNNTQTLSETLTNSGGTSITITAATATGTGFSITGLSLPLTLNAGQSTSFSASFAPTTTGAATGNISVSSNATNPTLTIPMSGTGVAPGALTANPTSLSFGSVTVGSNTTLSETLTNSGGTSVTITAASAPAGFSITGLSLPVTLTAGQTKTFSVIFAPTATGDVSGNLSITSNATNPTLTIPLTGTGLAAGTLSANPTSLSFGTVQVSKNNTLSETVTNTGGSNVTITAATATGSGFSVNGLTLPVTLTAGQSKSFNVVFAPTTGGSVSGNLAIVSNASNATLNVPLTGTGVTAGTLSANPTTNAFGNVQVSTSKLQSETLTNTGGTTVTVSQATVTGSSAFTISGLTLPLTLSAGQSFTFGVTFAPTTSGSATGSIAVTSDGSNPNLTISLTGSGFVPGQLTVNPTSLSFGTVTVGANKALTATLNATGSSVTVSSATISTSEFTISGLTLPKTITAGSSASFTVTYTPQATGASSATITFNSDAANTPALLSLSGTGAAPPQHNVNLSWNASTSSVVGYNVYRGTKTGGPYTQINSSMTATTSYVDDTVSSGQTYFYVTTAVDGSSAESGFSNEVKAVIPTP